MKIRNGFVSNSSSSSFIIAIKTDKDIKTKEDVLNLLGIQSKSLAAKLFEPFIKNISEDEVTIPSLMEYCYCKTEEELVETEGFAEEVGMIKNGWKLFEVSVDRYAVESISSLMDFSIDTENFKILDRS